MLKSMTGFGRGEGQGWVTEIRTVNHRFGDVAFRMSRSLSSLESRFKEEIKRFVRRGRVEVSCNPENPSKSEAYTISLEEQLSDQVYEILRRLKERYGFQDDVGLADLISFREIFRTQEESPDLDRVWDAILPSLTEALQHLDGMRLAEGGNLHQGLKESLNMMVELQQKIATRAPEVIEFYRERLHKRLKEIMPGDELDQGRLMQEIAIFSERSDITEEITRLSSHVDQFDGAMEGPGPTGRRLEFLLQEMNREVNTIGSKGNDMQISQWVVDCKSELEKMREQIQNVE